jgi:hypothetical protein
MLVARYPNTPGRGFDSLYPFIVGCIVHLKLAENMIFTKDVMFHGPVSIRLNEREKALVFILIIKEFKSAF